MIIFLFDCKVLALTLLQKAAGNHRAGAILKMSYKLYLRRLKGWKRMKRRCSAEIIDPMTALFIALDPGTIKHLKISGRTRTRTIISHVQFSFDFFKKSQQRKTKKEGKKMRM